MKKRSLKQSLLLNFFALLLCVSMLAGTTYAWFTDSVSGGLNQIAAGNLDVVLEYWNDGRWVPVETKTNVFSDADWEPGYTEVVYLRISNRGSLALQYDLGISVADEAAGINVAGEPFLLSSSLMFGVAGVSGENEYATRGQALEAVSLQSIGEIYTDRGTLLAGAPDQYLALVVTMPGTVGNEANRKPDTQPPSVDLGIRLTAYQQPQESDSFGDDYDANTVYTVSELQTAMYSGGMIRLGADLTVAGETVAWDFNGSETKKAHFYIPEGIQCTLDLNGRTLTNTHVSSSVRYDVIANYGTLTLTDSVGGGELISANNAANPNVSGGFAVISYGDLILRNVDIDSNTGSYAVYIEGDGKTMTVDGATVSGRGALAVYNGAHGIVNSGDFSIDVLTSNARDNVLALYNATAEVYGGNFDGTLKTLGSNDSFNWKGSSCVMLMGSSSVAHVYGGRFEAREADLFSHGAGCRIYAYGGSFNTVNALGNSALHEHNAKALVEIRGGTFVYDPGDYLAEGCSVTEKDGFWTVTAQ